ncbi:sigma factor [Sinomicrobium sp. M5D2P9]
MENRLKKEIESIFLKYYREWCLLSYSYVGSMDETQDIVHDVFVKVLLKKQEKEISNLKNYISTSVKNTSLKRIRHPRLMNMASEDNREFIISHEGGICFRRFALFRYFGMGHHSGRVEP